jgi:uncharacterized protein (DUF2267 family)
VKSVVDQQIIHTFAGVGGVSTAYFAFQIIRFFLNGMADRREAKAAGVAAAEAHQEAQDARIAQLEELLSRKALPPPEAPGGQGGAA